MLTQVYEFQIKIFIMTNIINYFNRKLSTFFKLPDNINQSTYGLTKVTVKHN